MNQTTTIRILVFAASFIFFFGQLFLAGKELDYSRQGDFPKTASAQEDQEFLSIINKLTTIYQRMKTAAERLERLNERLSSRQQKLADQGGETVIANELLGTARSRLRTANQEVLNLDIAISKAANSSSPYAEIGEAIAQVKTTGPALTNTLDSVIKAYTETRRVSEDL